MMIKVQNPFPEFADGDYIYIIMTDSFHTNTGDSTARNFIFKYKQNGLWYIGRSDFRLNYGIDGTMQLTRLFKNKNYLLYSNNNVIIKSDINDKFYSIPRQYFPYKSDLTDDYFQIPDTLGYPMPSIPSNFNVYKCSTLFGTYNSIFNSSTITVNVPSTWRASSGDKFGPYSGYFYGNLRYNISGGSINTDVSECLNYKFTKDIRGLSNPYIMTYPVRRNVEYPPNDPYMRVIRSRFWKDDKNSLFLHFSYLPLPYGSGRGYIITMGEPELNYELQLNKGFWFKSASPFSVIDYPYTNTSIQYPVGIYQRYYGGEEPDLYNFNLTVSYKEMYVPDKIGCLFICPPIWRSEYA